MLLKVLFAIVAVLTATSVHAEGIVVRAEKTELRLSHDKVVTRVERDSEGNVTGLRLDEMQLSPMDAAELGQIKHLRRLVLSRTNFTDDDLAHLKRCGSLEHLNLSSTEVTNDAIDTILDLKRLKSLCLGDVDITPDAIGKLKEFNRSRERASDHLRWGYSRRKMQPE